MLYNNVLTFDLSDCRGGIRLEAYNFASLQLIISMVISCLVVYSMWWRNTVC